jgi:hypothetical protein
MLPTLAESSGLARGKPQGFGRGNAKIQDVPGDVVLHRLSSPRPFVFKSANSSAATRRAMVQLNAISTRVDFSFKLARDTTRMVRLTPSELSFKTSRVPRRLKAS